MVAVDLGGAEPAADASRWALSWEPIGHTVVLPAFSGSLEIREHPDGTTERVVETNGGGGREYGDVAGPEGGGEFVQAQ